MVNLCLSISNWQKPMGDTGCFGILLYTAYVRRWDVASFVKLASSLCSEIIAHFLNIHRTTKNTGLIQNSSMAYWQRPQSPKS